MFCKSKCIIMDIDLYIIATPIANIHVLVYVCIYSITYTDIVPAKQLTWNSMHIRAC